MGIFDFLTSTRRPDKNTPITSVQELKEKILSVNRDSAPFQIIDGREESVDLIAEWKIVDAKWYEIFSKASLKSVFRIYMKFDEANKEVRAVDKEYTISWEAGIPNLSVAASFFRGQKQEVSFGNAYAFTEEFKPGQVYNYRFSTAEIKKPIQEAVTSCGWTYRGVSLGKL